jgi:DNA-binding CsgD family transcriptional regulator
LLVYILLLEDCCVLRYERPLDLLEAAYRMDGSEDEWVAALREAAAEVFAGEGLGAAAGAFTGRPGPGGFTIIKGFANQHAEGPGIAPGWRALTRLFPSIEPALQQRTFFSGAIADTWSSLSRLGPELVRHPQWTDRSGFNAKVANDALGLVCHSGPLAGVNISVPLRETQPLDDVGRRLWRRVAIHVGTALRLRRGVGPFLERAAAILTPKGRVEHVAKPGDAKKIEDGAARRRRARKGDLSPVAALDVWQGLLDGRWSLVDHVDTDGKAFVLAVANEPASDLVTTLTNRQRSAVALAALGYNNKQIAYSLGLAPTAVGMLLRRARLAMGTKTRAELVRAFKRSLASEG